MYLDKNTYDSVLCVYVLSYDKFVNDIREERVVEESSLFSAPGTIHKNIRSYA